jgi:hypothetical protein
MTTPWTAEIAKEFYLILLEKEDYNVWFLTQIGTV